MLDHTTAQKFVDKMKQMFDIEISIANEKGIIVASSQLDHIGDFHAIAYGMIQNHVVQTSDSNPSNTTIATHMLLRKDTNPYGVISISGPTKENEKIIEIIRYFFEALIDNPRYYLAKTPTQQSQLFACLFLEKPVNYTRVMELLHNTHRDPHVLRLPILVHLKNREHMPYIYQHVRSYLDESTQNLLFQINDYDILFFIKTTYKELFLTIIDETVRALDRFTEDPQSYQLAFTVPTDDITSYVLAYSQLMWLKSIYAMQDRKILNIIDTLDLLIVSSNGWDNYNNIFAYYHKKLQTYHYTEEFLQLADVLIQHNMNYAQAAKVLFVHKNTIVFRMNKLKSILGIDPYANQDHLALFSYLYYYISLDNHTLLSFQKEYDKYRS